MKYEKLNTAAKAITMPEDMKQRIIGNCTRRIVESRKEKIMKTGKTPVYFRKPATVFTVLAIVLSLSVTAVAASGALNGFFRDIRNRRGAVVGTSYEQSTDEIDMNADVNDNVLTVLASFVNPQAAPYVYSERLGIAAFQILDAAGTPVKEGCAEPVKMINGQAAIQIQLDDIDSGSYKLIITAFVSEKKADQPLNIHGYWECTFIK